MSDKKASTLDDLKSRIWTTKGSRFNAAHRLLKTSNLSFNSRCALAIYLILLNLSHSFEIIDFQNNSNIFAFTSISISIVLLVFEILENSKNFKVRANQFDKSAKELTKLLTKVNTKSGSSEEELAQYAIEFDEILENYENHLPIDYALQKTKQGIYFKSSWYVRVWINLLFNYIIHWRYYLAIIAPPLVILYWQIKLLINNS